MQENEKRNQNKKKEKNHAKQCHHKYEICLIEMILKKKFVSNFAYPKCMITCSMKKKRRGKEDEKRKKRFHFFDHQERTGHGF